MPQIQLIPMLKINLWMWYKVLQIQAQGPAGQNQAQGPAVQNQPPVQGPVNNNAQVGQNIPMQLQQQLTLTQPVPNGPGSTCPSDNVSKLDRKET